MDKDYDESLRYNGLRIVGRCTKCTLLIWGVSGEKTEHGYCGITPPK